MVTTSIAVSCRVGTSTVISLPPTGGIGGLATSRPVVRRVTRIHPCGPRGSRRAPRARSEVSLDRRFATAIVYIMSRCDDRGSALREPRRCQAQACDRKQEGAAERVPAQGARHSSVPVLVREYCCLKPKNKHALEPKLASSECPYHETLRH